MFVQIATRLFELFIAPFKYNDMLWVIIPLFITMLFAEIYTGRYKFIEFQWDSAFGNSLVLIFISLDLFRFLYNNDLLTYINVKNVIVFGMVTEGILLAALNFFHLLPKNFAFGLSNILPVNIVAYLAIILVYTDIPIDLITAIASILLAALLILILSLINLIVPESYED